MTKEITERQPGEYTLAIETAVEAGSFALFRKGILIDEILGAGVKSRSENVLPQIKLLLERNGAKKGEINSITVSNGPGSFTGARIGAALARGLSKSLGCRLSGVSVLEALAASVFFNESVSQPEREEPFTTAIPFGNSAVCLQRFTAAAGQIKSLQAPETQSRSNFIEQLKSLAPERAILHETLYLQVSDFSRKNDFFKNRRIINSGGNLAVLIGCRSLEIASEKNYAASEIAPIYVRTN